MSHDQRTPERLRHHYEVEKELAGRLRRSTRAERTALFAQMYDELFARVPDHPRLTRRDTEEQSRRAVAARLAMLESRLRGDQVFLEIAPGDCRLAFAVCPRVKEVIGVDISDQSGQAATVPPNFRLVVYDGYTLDLPADSVDLAFSYQFLEHLHPDDVDPHLQMIRRVLKPGGAYVFSTPHAYSGPHDISCHFSDVPEGFHFQEWTHGQMFELLRRNGFRAAYAYRFGRARESMLANHVITAVERVFGWLPAGLRRRLSRRLFLSVNMVAYK